MRLQFIVLLLKKKKINKRDEYFIREKNACSPSDVNTRDTITFVLLTIDIVYIVAEGKPLSETEPEKSLRGRNRRGRERKI